MHNTNKILDVSLWDMQNYYLLVLIQQLHIVYEFQRKIINIIQKSLNHPIN